MKMKGFTLAEVLITLAIIGVVAVLTIPSLMTNTGEQQALTAYKKIINSLNEAGQISAAIDGFDYSGISSAGSFTDRVKDGSISLSALFRERLSVNEATAGAGFVDGAKEHCSTAPVFTLRDGTAVCIGGTDYNLVTNTNGAPYIKIWVDTNGPKGPNKASKCAKEGCANKKEKMIYDQFPVTLYQGMAIPGHWTDVETNGTTVNDNAARYAMGISLRSSK